MKRPSPLTVIPLLLVGAVINVAVSWGVAILPTHCVWKGPSANVWHCWDRSKSIVMLHTQPGRVDVCQDTGIMSSYYGDAESINDAALRSKLPAWSALQHSNPAVDRYLFDYKETSSGWPMLALKGHSEAARASVYQTQYTGMISLPWSFGRPSGMQMVPITPILPGFAINTAFYAAICWLLFAAPFAVRRRRRIKRGLCPACAYPVGTSDLCTECGRPVTLRHRRLLP